MTATIPRYASRASRAVTQGVGAVTFSRDPRSGHGKRHTSSRRARHENCTTCGTPVLTGLDADLLAGRAVVSPVPLTVSEEAAEWSAGRRTYTWHALAGELDFRDRWRITHMPANRHTVYPTHTCPEQGELL